MYGKIFLRYDLSKIYRFLGMYLGFFGRQPHELALGFILLSAEIFLRYDLADVLTGSVNLRCFIGSSMFLESPMFNQSNRKSGKWVS